MAALGLHDGQGGSMALPHSLFRLRQEALPLYGSSPIGKGHGPSQQGHVFNRHDQPLLALVLGAASFRCRMSKALRMVESW